ncbi:FG-GAP repeat domain-containing protein [Mucilaginibacter agri]|uniref:VCBS repeat-containing protein n=1 Tax=Mucilaginibacter agri TaxID=2695265 RepID=A0A965ZDE6_9SPHI|nr:VCBS repeat-containing protein [Mucilaginibacter agri]NCD67979.1 VCBS repeat-containing protein [Mucilaginibacter agri]
MNIKLLLFVVLFLSVFLLSLNSFTIKKIKPADDTGHELFIRHCSVCHMLAEPTSLTKVVWETHVLPVMASRMGIIYPGFDPLKGLSEEERKIVAQHHIIPNEAVMTDEDWKKLTKYVINNAPDSIPLDERRLNRNLPLKNFIPQDIELDKQTPSLFTSLKYNESTHTLWIGDFYNRVFNWKYPDVVTAKMETKSPVVDFNFRNDTTYFTEIGKLYPTELSTGSFVQFAKGNQTTVLPELHRPVSSLVEDLNKDGIPEIVVCNFGNKTGSFSLFKKNRSDAKYEEDILLLMPGAIKIYIKDMDGDGKKDIVAMFAQGDESVYIFYQKDNLKFRARRVLRFPPNYGTTDMVLTDYNHDGLTDIITVHGDNADFSPILKPYHGIRININAGNGTFKEKYFYPLYGVTKVLAEDFDKDGDIDLVATAFFPDFNKLVDESFVYLENVDQDKFTFKSYTLKRDVPIKTLALEKADIDGDGDMDIITGNFAQSPGQVPKQLDDKWKAAKYGLTIFMNQLYQPKK